MLFVISDGLFEQYFLLYYMFEMMMYLKFISICGILTFPSTQFHVCMYIYIYYSHYNVDIKH